MTPIRQLDAAAARVLATELAGLLIDAVDGGASVGFPRPLKLERAEQYWLEVADSIDNGRTLLLAAGDPTIGTVQLHFTAYPNGRHRAEVAKLLVHSSSRKLGLGTQLMGAVERAAAGCGKTLLFLDTQTDSEAERLYRSLGWELGGTIPDFAYTSDGVLAPSSFFFKHVVG